MDGEVVKIKVDPVPAKDEAACRNAMQGCPVEAISMLGM